MIHPALLKIAKHRVEASQRVVSGLEAEKQMAAARIERFDIETPIEAASADGDLLAMSLFPAFAQAREAERRRLAAAIGAVETKLETARADVRDAFTAQKKYEWIVEKFAAERERALAAVDNARMDETAARMAQRG
ncbi:MAG TPA: hypothetical protein DCZ49_06300 [Hyphomonadaceae bacterium]|nr:hypothetical protein [Hyphomonadaceae bacterium]